MTAHYVQYMFPGLLMCDSSHVRVTSREQTPKIPDGCVAFRFCDRTERQEAGETITGAFRNHSGWIYEGEIWHLERVKKEMPRESILISNMECNGYSRVVITKRGGTYPMQPGDGCITDFALLPTSRSDSPQPLNEAPGSSDSPSLDPTQAKDENND